jgi:lytic murein transglycosylase
MRVALIIAPIVAALIAAAPLPSPARAADAAFQQFLQSLRPQAEQRGISRATFDAATRDLEPDLSLPDLTIPGQPKRVDQQPEFVQTPADYLREASLTRLAAQGRALAAEHRATLARIERDFGVPASVVLAIWGRESGFGRSSNGRDAIRVLATQAYLGRRKEQFREELLFLLKMLQEGHATRAQLRSSWAGAMGLTQFLPSEFYQHAVDFDGDGRRDIWNSVPDALASAAKQLVNKGWQRDRRWAFEVRAPKNVDCTVAQPGHTMPVGAWLERGYAPLGGRKPSASELAESASLLLPEGTYGPAFLTLKNYYVIKDYNFSDLYVLFVGNLADRIAGGGPFVTPWSKASQLHTTDVERMQQTLTRLGLYQDKIDGKAGMLTRSALGAYQKANGLKLDCWPTRAVLDHMANSKP